MQEPGVNLIAIVYALSLDSLSLFSGIKKIKTEAVLQDIEYMATVTVDVG